jgi:membrane-associated protein
MRALSAGNFLLCRTAGKREGAILLQEPSTSRSPAVADQGESAGFASLTGPVSAPVLGSPAGLVLSWEGMELIAFLVDFVLHIDQHLDLLIQAWGLWVYLLLFLIVFCETGLVITPFLPGDSLLFAVGAFAARGSLDLAWVFILLIAAAILGDTVNYWLGQMVGPKVFQSEKSRLLNRKHLIRTHEFYERHGGKTIIIARFVPIIRTFAPFVAGIGEMAYARFLSYNVIGAFVWVFLFVIGGYYFGNLEIVRRNFTLVIFAIILISVMPGVVEVLRHRARPAASPAGE